jgi:hypothetical protein
VLKFVFHCCWKQLYFMEFEIYVRSSESCLLNELMFTGVCRVCAGVPGDQCLAFQLMSVRNKTKPVHVDRMPLSPKSTLTWIGYNVFRR